MPEYKLSSLSSIFFLKKKRFFGESEEEKINPSFSLQIFSSDFEKESLQRDSHAYSLLINICGMPTEGQALCRTLERWL